MAIKRTGEMVFTLSDETEKRVQIEVYDGEDGLDGKSLHIKGRIESLTDLMELTPEYGDIYYVVEEEALYVYDEELEDWKSSPVKLIDGADGVSITDITTTLAYTTEEPEGEEEPEPEEE